MLHDSFMIFIHDLHDLHFSCLLHLISLECLEEKLICSLKNSGRRTVAITAIEIRGQHLST